MHRPSVLPSSRPAGARRAARRRAAAWFPRRAPSTGPAEIDALGDVDLARDGTGGVVYLKRDAGVPQVFLSRFDGGAWQPPEQLDRRRRCDRGGRHRDRRRPAGRRVDRGRRASSARRDRQRRAAQAALGPPCSAAPGGATGVAIDMGINEDGYAVWSGRRRLRRPRRRLDGTAWTPLAAPLDIDPAAPAGARRRRPRVACQRRGQRGRHLGRDRRRRPHPRGRAAPDRARRRPRSRRTSLATSAARPAGAPTRRTSTSRTTARSPGSRSARTSAGARAPSRGGCAARVRGRSRSTAGRARARAADRLPAGQGHGGARGRGGSVVGSAYYNSTPSSPARRARRRAGRAARRRSAPPSAATSTSPGAPAPAAAATSRRRKHGAEKRFEPEFVALQPGVRPGRGRASSRSAPTALGSTAVAMLQGAPARRAITAAVYDRLPGPAGRDRAQRAPASRGRVKWRPGRSSGARSVPVRVDGKVVGKTTGNALVPPRRLRAGRAHRYQVTATDRARPGRAEPHAHVPRRPGRRLSHGSSAAAPRAARCGSSRAPTAARARA